MRIRGNIRRGQNGIDVGFQEQQGNWSSLKTGALKQTIELFYSLILSSDNRRIINGKPYNVQNKATKNGTVKTVSFPIAIGNIHLTKYSNGFDGKTAQSDRVGIEIEIPTNEEFDVALDGEIL